MKSYQICLSIIILLWLFNPTTKGQKPNYTLQTDNSASDKTYLARDYIVLKNGFKFSAANANKKFKASIDAGLLFPPTENTYALPNGNITTDPTLGAVVGSIPGQFAVSPTGAATYTIPIEVPAGINGVQPNISVGYSSQAGYGTLGTGWNIIGVSAITRGGKNLYFDTDTKGVNFDNTDVLYLDGQRLIYLSGGSGHFTPGAEYGTEIEDFSRVRIFANTDSSIYFQVTTVDGKKMTYGQTADSRLHSAKTDDLNRVLSWKINSITDTYNNSVNFFYEFVELVPAYIIPAHIERVLVPGYFVDQEFGSPTWIEESYEDILVPDQYIPAQKSDHHLVRIEYGTNSIQFDYTKNNTYAHNSILSGFKLTNSELLQSITTKIGATTIKKYHFDYGIQDKLKEIKLSDGNKISVNSSRIIWGNKNIQPEFIAIGNVVNSNLNNYPKGTSSVDFADINGDGYNDRVERWIGNSSTTGFINVYFYNNTTKSFSNTISTTQIITYTDFEKFKQQFLFVDINNDAKEEIIYTNNNYLHVLTYVNGNLLPFFSDGRGAYNTKTIVEADNDNLLRITTNDVNYDGILDIVLGYYDRGIFDNGERGCAIFFGSKNGLTVNPLIYQTNPNYTLDNFDFGDFNADGKLDMFCIPSKEDLVQPKLSDQILVENDYIKISTSNNLNINNFYASEPSDFKVIDINNDGLSDWLFCGSTDNKWRINITDGFGLYDNNTTILPFSGKDCQFIDINGDGLVDVVKYTNKYHTETVPLEIVYDESGKEVHEYDYQGNIISTKDIQVYDSTSWNIYINTGNGNFTSTLDFVNNIEINDNKLITFSDINSDGIVDLIFTLAGNLYALTLPKANQQNLVTSVTNGMGLKESISYKNLSEYEPFHEIEVNAKIRPLRAPLLVVDTLTHIDGSKTVYSFVAPKYHTHGKGFLGFVSIITSNLDNNVKSIINYEINQTFFFPALYLQSVSTIGGNNDISYTSQTNSVKIVNSALKRYIPYVSFQNNTDALKSLTQTTSTNYDNYPNSLTQTTKAGDLTTTTVTTFTGPPYKTVYLPSSVVTTRTQDSQTFTKATNYSFTFDDTNPFKITEKTETVDPGDINSVSTTYSNFDSWGHPQNIAITANGKTRNSSVKYFNTSNTEANAGQYLRSRTNELNETTKYSWNESTGLLESETDPRGNKTFYKYTSFGQLSETVYPDGLRKATTLQWTGSDGVIGSKYYSFSVTSGNAPVTVWYDILGRQIQTDTYGLNEKKISISTEYYVWNDYTSGKRKGMLYRISEPYFEADAGNIVWAKTLTYDQYGRTVKAITPMGELSNQYNFLTTTVTTPENTTITKLNSAGQVISSEVNGKAVSYKYYPSGLLMNSTPAGGKSVSMVYNKQGKQILITDPNSGVIRTEYNGFGELLLSVQRVHLTGDSIRTIYTYKSDGRLESINRNGEITSYTYNSMPNYERRLNTIELRNRNNVVQNRQTFTYDLVSYADRISEFKEEIINNNGYLKAFVKKTEYDVLGRTKKEVFPSGYSTFNKFDVYSNLTEQNDETGRIIWKAIDENAKGQLLHIAKGTKISTYDYYDNGLTKEIKSDNVIDLYYEYDSKTHNLTSREDLIGNQKETFTYDGLNRLTNWNINRNGVIKPHSIVYDAAYGTITRKSDLGAFTLKYGGEQEDGTKLGIADGSLIAPHALTSIIPDQGTTGLPMNFPAYNLEVKYTDFKKIATLNESSKFYRLSYGTDDERIKSEYFANGQNQGSPTFTRYYIGDYEEVVDAAGNTKKIHYLSGAILIKETRQTDKFYYSYADFQGSLIALTDAYGNVVERYAYDPWGARRNPTDWTQKDNRTTWIVNRGYTGHEHLDAFGIINMNGRVYDPLTAQFFSPDPVLTDAGNWLDYNRFGYCLNNPFRYTDPSGYTWWAENGKMVITTTASMLVGSLVAIATAGTGVPAMIMSGMASGAAGGALGTALSGGSFNDAMKAGLQGAVVGGIAGIAGGATSQVVSNAISVGGFLGGAITGAAGGASGGFVGGSMGAWLNGASLGEGLLAGLKGAGMGAAMGGLIGGLSSGVSDYREGYNFWDGSSVEEFIVNSRGYIEIAKEYNSSGQADLNDEILQSRLKNEFGVKVGDLKIDEITTKTSKGYGMTNSGKYVNLKSMNLVGGYVKLYSKGNSNIHISPYYSNGTIIDFKAIVGHELIHVFHNFSLPYVNEIYSERVAYKYTHDLYFNNGYFSEASSIMRTAIFNSTGLFWGKFPSQYQIPSPSRYY